MALAGRGGVLRLEIDQVLSPELGRCGGGDRGEAPAELGLEIARRDEGGHDRERGEQRQRGRSEGDRELDENRPPRTHPRRRSISLAHQGRRYSTSSVDVSVDRDLDELE